MTQTQEVMGVQELIDRIRSDGVESARQEADRIMHEARAQAEAIVSQARRESQERHDELQAQIEAEQQAALEAVRLAARNVVMDLKAKVAAVFENQVRRLVSTATEDRQFVRELVLALAGKASKEIIRGEPIEILLSGDGSVGQGRTGSDRLGELILGVSSEMLREGVTLVPDTAGHHGARVRVVGSDLEIDLTEDAVTRLMLQHMLPRFWRILQGVE